MKGISDRYRVIAIAVVSAILITAGVYASAAAVFGTSLSQKLQSMLVSNLEETLHRDVTVSKISPSLPGIVEISDLKIAKGKNIADGILLAIPKAKVHVDVLSLLLQRAKAAGGIKKLEAMSAEAWLTRDKNGRWNIADLLDQLNSKNDEMFNGTISFADSKVHISAEPDGSILNKRVNETLQLKDLSINLTNRLRYTLDSSFKLTSLGDSVFSVNGKYSAADDKYELNGTFSPINLAVLATRLPVKLPAINLEKGSTNGEYSISLDRSKGLKYSCILNVSDINGNYRYSGDRLIKYSDVTGRIVLSDKGLALDDVDADIFGGKVIINGSVTGWRATELDLSVNTKKTNIGALGALFKVADAGLHISGQSNADLLLKGALDAPSIKGTIHLFDAGIASDKLGEKLSSVNGSVKVAGDNLSSIQLTAKYLGKDCSITGDIFNYKEPVMDLTADFPMFEISMINRWLPGLDKKVFDAAGEHILHATGSLKAITLSGELKIPRGSAWGIPVKNLIGRYTFNDNQFVLPALTAEVFGGSLIGSGSTSITEKSVVNAYVFNIDKAEPGDMSQLVDTWLPQMNGRSLARGPFNGSFIWNSDATSGSLLRGQLNVENGEVLGNACSTMALNFDIRDNVLKINKLVGVNGDELRPFIFNAQGTVNLDEPRDMDIVLDADNFALASLVSDSDKYLTGLLDFNGQLSGTPKDWMIDGIVSGIGNTITGLASDSLSGPVEIRQDRITLNGLDIKRGLAVYTANGSYNIKDYSLNGTLLVDKGSFYDVRELAYRHAIINKDAADKLYALCKDTGLISGSVTFGGSLNSLSVNGDVDLTSLKVANESVSGNSTFAYGDGVLKLDKLNINGANLQIAASGVADTTEKSAQIKVDGLHIPVSFVEAIAERNLGAQGNITVKGDLSSNYGKFGFKGRVLLEDGVYDNLKQIVLDTYVDYSKDSLLLDDINLGIGSSTRVLGRLFINGWDTALFEGSINDFQLDYLSKVKFFNRFDMLTKFKGSLTGEVHIDGPVSSPNVGIKGQISSLSINDVILGDGEYELSRTKSRYDINKFNIHSSKGNVQAMGFIDTSNLMNLEIVCKDIDLTNATRQRAETIKGNLGLIAQITGSYLNPTINTDFIVESGSYHGVEFGELSCGVTVKSGSAIIQSSNLELGNAAASAAGAIKFSDQALDLVSLLSSLSHIVSHPRSSKAQVNLALDVSKDSLSILPLLTTAVESGQGGEELHLKVGGTLETPIIKGEGIIKGGSIKFTGLREPFRDINSKINLDGSRVVINELQAKGSEGTINGRLSIDLGGSSPLALDSELYLNSLRLPQPLDVLANGKISITNTLYKPLIVGDVMLYSGTISVPVIGVSRPSSSRVDAKKWEPSFNILAVIGDDIRFKSSLIGEMDLVGSLRLTGTLNAPSLEGIIDSPRGNFIYLGTKFDITEGHAEFRKGTIPQFNNRNLNPHINLKGETIVKGTKIYLDVNGDLSLDGPMDALVTKVRSNPPLSEREIWSLLSIPSRIEAFSNAGFEEGIKGEVQTILMDQLRQTLVGGVEDVFRNSLKIDEFKVEQDVNNGYNLRLGKQYNNVFITYINGLRSDPLQGIKIDYMLKEGVSLSGQIDSKRDFRLFLDTHFRF